MKMQLKFILQLIKNAIRNRSLNKENSVGNALPPPSTRFNFNTNQ